MIGLTKGINVDPRTPAFVLSSESPLGENSVICETTQCLEIFCKKLSILLILNIILERCVAVQKPLYVLRNDTRSRAKKVSRTHISPWLATGAPD